MHLREALAGVHLNQYNHERERDQPAQRHLQEVRKRLPDLLPPGMLVRTSGAGQSLPVVPWIALLDKDVTTTALQGLYVVYLYRKDLTRVYLSMNQGATHHQRNAVSSGLKGVAADRAAIAELATESGLLQHHLGDELKAGLVPSIGLGARRQLFLPCAYEAGNIAAVEYDTNELPAEEILLGDLSRFLALYATCVEIKREVLATDPGAIRTKVGEDKPTRSFRPKPPAFRPKTSADYQAHMRAYLQERKPRHEALLNLFAQSARAAGLITANNAHPCDLTVTGRGSHWLVEVKTVGANAEHAVRDAIGQLFSYRHFCYRHAGRPDPLLVALFSEPVGDALVDLLVSVGIETIWRAGTAWCGRAPADVSSLLHAATAPAGIDSTRAATSTS